MPPSGGAGSPPEDLISNEELQQMLNGTRLEQPPSTPSSEAVPPSGSEETPGSAGESVETPPTTPSTPAYRFDDGSELDAETAQRYRALDQYLEANPQMVATLQGIATGTLQIAQPQQEQIESPASTIPEDIDQNDPTVKFFMDRLSEYDTRYKELQQQVAGFGPQIEQQNLANAEAIVNRVARSFQSDRNLSDEQMSRLREAASQMNVLQSYMSPVDPVSGLPRRVDSFVAVEKALEAAYWTVPELRDAEVNRQLEERRQVNERKGKMASLGGSSGSTPRTKGEPKNDAERRAAMIEELAPHFNS